MDFKQQTIMSNQVIDIGVKIILSKFIETRALIEGDSGSGKSRLIRKMAEVNCGKVQQILIDPEDDFITLREKFPFALVSKVGGDIPLNLRHVETLVHKILETGISVIFGLYELKKGDRELFVKLFCEAMIEAPKNIRRECIVYFDEAHLFCPEDKGAISYDAMIDFCTRGRKRGLCAVLATQRISILSKSAAAQCKNRFIGGTGLDIDQKRAGAALGLATREEIRNLANLDPGEFYCFGPAISRTVIKFRSLEVKTTHVKSGKKQPAPPPTPDAIKKILGKLESIPEEAEKELKSKSDMQAEIKRLTAELRKKPVVQDTGAAEQLKKDLGMKKQELQGALHELVQTQRKCKQLETNLSKIANIASDKVTEVKSGGLPLPKDFVDHQGKIVMVSPNGTRTPITLKKDKPDGKITVHKTSAAAVILSRHPMNKDQDTSPLPPGEKAILIACAQFGHAMDRNQLTVLTGYKRSSRDAYIQRLKTKGYLNGAGSNVEITEAGAAALGDDYEPLPTGLALQEYWLNKLPPGERAILEVLIEHYPNPVERDVISEDTGYMRSSRDAYIQRMSSKEIVTTEGRGLVKASDNLFD